MRLVPGRVRRLVRPMQPSATILRAWRELPVVDVATLFGDRPVLVLAPHPDDESLGCGGTIAECQASGRAVHVLVLTDGAASHPKSGQYPPRRLAALRAEEAREAGAELGLAHEQVRFLGLPDGQAPCRGQRLRETAARVAAMARAIGAGTICATSEHDPHNDHRAAHRIGVLAARQAGAKLLLYPVWSWALPPRAWLPKAPARGARIDIARHLPAKRRAIACHRSQTTDLIADDPSGFRLSPEVLALFDQPFEVFLEPPPAIAEAA